MVEGPGCKLKGEKIRARLLRQTAKAVKGNAVEREQKGQKKKDDPGVTQTSFHRIIGQNLDEVLTLGKELFLFFGEACLRVHFLMAGSFRINNQEVDKDGGKAAATASLEIQLSKDCLTFYKCAAEIRPSSACRQKCSNLKDLDVCSPSFSPKRAVAEVMAEGDRQLCDVLLDQDILPGVGNIIKNEALFDSGLKPDTKVKELTEEHISHLIKMTRDFSMVFYKCRKNGTNLRNFMKVYQKGKCGECGTKITMTRMGDDSERVTYFCPTCQTNDLKKICKLKLPSKNSLLGWVTSDQHADKEEWSCSKCTLLNPANQTNCSACLASRNSKQKEDSGESPAVSSPKQSPANAATRKRKFGQDDSASLTVVTETVNTPNKRAKAEQTNSNSSSFSSDFDSSGLLKAGRLTQNLKKKSEGNNLRKISATKQAVPNEQGDEGDCSKIPLCSEHKRKCAMRQTFKDNENKGRWFFTCTFGPASKRCNFFKWADEDFPKCTGHGKVCAFRTVMKQGPNNGRKFFCCAVKRSSCNFFEWATGYT